jgi:hypothetical protein
MEFWTPASGFDSWLQPGVERAVASGKCSGQGMKIESGAV